MLQISKNLFTQWNNKGLLYCHWKSNEHLEPGLNGETDLDVLLAKENKEEGEKILRELDFLQCKSQFGSRYPDVDDWIGFDAKTGSLIHLHLHYRIVTGHSGMKEYDLPWTEEALNTRIQDQASSVYIMEPNLEFVTLYTRIGLKCGFINRIKKIKGTYKFSKDLEKEINYLKNKISWERITEILNPFFKKDTEKVLKIMQLPTLSIKEVLLLKKITEKTFAAYNREHKAAKIKEIGYYIILRFRQKFRKNFGYIVRKVPKTQKGLTITFIGQDGAGKTTVCSDIIKWLNWKLDVRYYYLGSGDNYKSLIKSILDFLPKWKLFKPVRGLLFLGEFYKLSIDINKYLSQAEKYSSQGGFAILDRFPQADYKGVNDGPKLQFFADQYVKSKHIRPLFNYWISKEERNIQKASKQSPNLVFKLLLSPEESLRRKPNENFEMVKLKHNIIKNLKFENSIVTEVDATMSYNDEIILIKSVIWQNIQK